MTLATTLNLSAPSGYGSAMINCRSGNTYNVDNNGYVANVKFVDLNDLLGAGFTVVSNTFAGRVLVGKLIGANFNVTTDQQITLSSFGEEAASNLFFIDEIIVTNASVSLTTAAGGFYTAAAKGGTAIVSAAQVYTALTDSSHVLQATIAVRRTPADAVFLADHGPGCGGYRRHLCLRNRSWLMGDFR